MLGMLTEKMQNLCSRLVGKKTLNEDNIAEAMREVRLALLEADVNYTVAKLLVQRVKDKAIGDAVIKSVTPGQQFIQVVHDELVQLMGGDEVKLNVKGSPAIFLMCGLQGSGKTTHTAKIAHYLKKEGRCRKPLLVACDLQRPAAVDQLIVLGRNAHVPVFHIEGEKDPLRVAKAALVKAKEEGFDLMIVDTAGRLHIDEEMMQQLVALKSLLTPQEILFVANATTGQDAVNIAREFNARVEMSGTILTMLDGNTRGGAAISIREVTGKPLLFEGIGEKLDDMQAFNPHSMADRILGMGDTINLVRKAKEHINEDDAQKMEEKLRKATFTYDDYLSQIGMVKKMGSLKGLLGMLPGMSALKDLPFDEKEFFKVEAIIQSMTPKERLEQCDLIAPRRKRVAKGSGTSIDDVNKLVKSFKQAKQFFKQMPNMKNMEKLMGGFKWR